MNNKTVSSMKYFLYLFGLLVLSLSAQAASSDCAKAQTKVEHLICDDAEISKLDEELNAAYKTALQDEKQADSIKQIQKKWIKERNGCLTVACLKTTYQARIYELNATQKRAGARLQPDTDEYVLVKQDPEQTGEYLSHIEPDPQVCQLYQDNLNYFAHQNTPMSCNRPIAPQFKNRIQEVEWEDLKPADYPELFRQVVLFNSFGYDKSHEALKKHEAKLGSKEYVFRRAKLELSGELSWHGYTFGQSSPMQHYSGKFYIVQYGRNNMDAERPPVPCKLVRGNTSKQDYTEDLEMYEVNAEMNAIINQWGTLDRGVRGEHMRLIDGKPYVEKNAADASVYLLRVNLEFPVFLESLCKYQFKQFQARR